MRIRAAFLGIMLLSICAANAQVPFKSYAQKMKVKSDSLESILLIPQAKMPVPLLILVSGSGPTDMDGNNWSGPNGLINNSLKMLAEGIAARGIASLRYDKRGISTIKAFYKNKKTQNPGDLQRFEEQLRFDDYVNDLDSIVRVLKKDKRFSKIIIAGHSEGSLIGMLSARANGINGFISLAGPAFPADSVLLDQIRLKSKPEISEEAGTVLKKLKAGEKIDTIYHPSNRALFRPSIRPYMSSWFRHDPSLTLASLKMPVLVIHGTTDLQVAVSHADALHKAAEGSGLMIIQNMNHILKITPGAFENQVSYNHPTMPVSAELVDGIENFIKKLP